MNNIESLCEHIRLLYPQAATELTEPARPTGIWSLEVNLAGRRLVIDWSQTSGFGVTDVASENFGEGPDELYQSLERTERRVDQLLSTDERTSPHETVLLARLRERRGLTQRDLADRLGVRQATISGIERRDDVQLSTLRRVVEALGGQLEVFGSFPDARYRIESPPSCEEDRSKV